jgi:hypothetical protein
MESSFSSRILGKARYYDEWRKRYCSLPHESRIWLLSWHSIGVVLGDLATVARYLVVFATPCSRAKNDPERLTTGASPALSRIGTETGNSP